MASIAFVLNDVLKVPHGEIELTTPVLGVRILNHYAMARLPYKYSRLIMAIYELPGRPLENQLRLKGNPPQLN